jgi:phospholipase C
LLTRDHEIMALDAERLLIWDRRTGELELRALDPLAADPLAGALLSRETHDRLRSLPRDWPPETQSKIRRTVIVLQQGRSFDHHFGHYCQAPAGSEPKCTMGAACCEAMPESIPGAAACHPVDPTLDDHIPEDSPLCLLEKINGGAMDRFAMSTLEGCGHPRDFACLRADTAGPMAAYHRFAREGALADRFFQTLVGSWDLNLIYFGSTAFGEDLSSQGGEPITALLAARHVPWALYLGDPVKDSYMQSTPNHYDARWSHFRWLDELMRDIQREQLGSVTVVIPPLPLSEAAGAGPPQRGAELLTTIVDALGSSPYRDDTLILIGYLTAGGFFDHVAPPPTPSRSDDPYPNPYGPRVPLLVVGRFAKVNHVSHVPLEISSITKFLEWNWLGGKTGQLGGRDNWVNNLGDLLEPSVTVTAVPVGEMPTTP